MSRGPAESHPGQLKDGMWSGRRCFVIGGGPSLEGYDWSQLELELTIAVNATSFNMGHIAPDIAFTMDAAWAEKQFNSGQWHSLVSEKVFHDVSPPGWPLEKVHHYGFHSHIKSAGWLNWGSSLEEGLVYSCNSGLAAINLADVLGASPIYLLGFDGHGGHFHDEYSGPPTETYHGMNGGWHEACVGQVRGDVVNLNLGSSLPWEKGMLV